MSGVDIAFCGVNFTTAFKMAESSVIEKRPQEGYGVY